MMPVRKKTRNGMRLELATEVSVGRVHKKVFVLLEVIAGGTINVWCALCVESALDMAVHVFQLLDLTEILDSELVFQ